MNDAQPTSSRLLLIVAASIALAFIAIVTLFGFVGLGLMTGRVADTKVLPGNKLPSRVAQTVTASAGLAPGERILYFYSSAMTPKGDGNLLTDKRVISYVDDGTNPWCDFIAVGDIASVDFTRSESWLDDSTVVVTSSDGSQLTLYASGEGGGDVRFVDAIRRAAKLDGG